MPTGATPANGCVCPGDTLTYECTTDKGEATVWLGGAFDCPNGNMQIILHYHQFSDGGAFGSCNDGSIVARGVSVEGNNYTSQLNVTVTPDIAGEEITCYYIEGTNIFPILSVLIPRPGLS